MTNMSGRNFTRNAERLSNATGAYLLKIRLSAELTTRIESLENPRFGRGTYIYAGSANGPGGIRARCRRHLQREKILRWHVDHLTCQSTDLAAAGFPGDDECRLIDVLANVEGVTFPIPRFGSSDCPLCPSHLVKVPANLNVLTIFDDVR